MQSKGVSHLTVVQDAKRRPLQGSQRVALNDEKGEPISLGGYVPNYAEAIDVASLDGSVSGQDGEHDYVPASTPCLISVAATVFHAVDGDSVTLAVVGTVGEWTGAMFSVQHLSSEDVQTHQTLSLIIPPDCTYRVDVAGNATAAVTEIPSL